jgi:8-oxo-dGTP pyrophosphatase MutT (NUDIX family)
VHKSFLFVNIIPGIEKSTCCCTGGRLEDEDRSPVDGALRELLEETGLSPKVVRDFGAFAQIPAVETGRVHLFLVECEAAPLRPNNRDHTEDIFIEFVPITRLEELIAAGDMDCVACVAASYKLLFMARSSLLREC